MIRLCGSIPSSLALLGCCVAGVAGCADAQVETGEVARSAQIVATTPCPPQMGLIGVAAYNNSVNRYTCIDLAPTHVAGEGASYASTLKRCSDQGKSLAQLSDMAQAIEHGTLRMPSFKTVDELVAEQGIDRVGSQRRELLNDLLTVKGKIGHYPLTVSLAKPVDGIPPPPANLDYCTAYHGILHCRQEDVRLIDYRVEFFRCVKTVFHPSASSAQLPAPVAAWSFDECHPGVTPTSFADATNVTGPAFPRDVRCARGLAGGAPVFDGGAARVQVPDRPSARFSETLTVMAWVKPEGVRGAQTIVNKWYAKDSYMLLVEDDRFVFRVALPGGAWGEPHEVSGPALAGVWTHVAGTCDGATLRLYLSGQLAAQKTLPRRGLQQSDRPLVIGNHPSWNAFRGQIDQLKLFDVALSPDAIIRLWL